MIAVEILENILKFKRNINMSPSINNPFNILAWLPFQFIFLCAQMDMEIHGEEYLCPQSVLKHNFH